MIIKRKGIILAGGSGSRLSPITYAVCKQLLPLFNKPMIYYPLTTLMLSGIKDILIIVSSKDVENFQNLLGDGSQWGISLNYKIQEKPDGVAQAFIIGEEFIGNDPVALILGDNFFHAQGLTKILQDASNSQQGATLFAYPVRDPERFGIINFDSNFKIKSFEEKPKFSKSKYAITGLYFYDNNIIEMCKGLKFSSRGELEITDINNLYLKENNIKVEILGRGTAWIDTGTPESLHEAGAFVKTLEERQSLKIGCPEEAAWRLNWIDDKDLISLAKSLKNDYGKYLLELIQD